MYSEMTEQEWSKLPLTRTRNSRTPNHRRVATSLISDIINDKDNRHCYLMDRKVSSKELSILSKEIGGSIWGRPDHFVHQAGHYSETYIYKEKWPEYLAIREAVQSLLGVEDVGYTPSQCARRVDSWLGFKEGQVHPDLVHYLLPNFSFCAAIPTTLPQAYEHDMSGAYWQIVKASPTPRIRIYRNLPQSVGSKKMDLETRTKWEAMIRTIEPHKGARLAIVGNWVGSYSPRNWRYSTRWYYVNGEKRISKPRLSRLSTFGLLIVRLVYELCQEEFLQDNGHYAWVDCVITTSDVATYWKSIGIPYTLKGSGDFELHRSDVYRLGNKRVGIWFKNAKPPHVTTLPRLIPRDTYYHRRLLPQWGVIPTSLEELPPIKHFITLPPYNMKLSFPPPTTNISPKQPDFTETIR